VAALVADVKNMIAPEDADSESAPETEVVVALADEDKVQQAIRDAEGKALVVNIWATWCLPCIAEMPELASFYTDMDSERVAFLSLSADQAYTLEDTVQPFAKERKLPFPVYVMDFTDPDPVLLAKMLGVSETKWDGALPATFVLDQDRKLVRHWFEEVKPGELQATVESLDAGDQEP
jgi:peroxiredoxin